MKTEFENLIRMWSFLYRHRTSKLLCIKILPIFKFFRVFCLFLALIFLLLSFFRKTVPVTSCFRRCPAYTIYPKEIFLELIPFFNWVLHTLFFLKNCVYRMSATVSGISSKKENYYKSRKCKRRKEVSDWT